MLLRAVNAGWLGGGLGFGDSIYSLHFPGEAAAGSSRGRKEGRRRMKEMVAKRWRGGKGQLQLGVPQP